MRVLMDGMTALGLRPYLAPEHQGPIIATFHQPPGPEAGGRFVLQDFVDALKQRGVLISNFHTTEAPTLRIGCIGAITPDDMRHAVAVMGEVLEEMGVLA